MPQSNGQTCFMSVTSSSVEFSRLNANAEHNHRKECIQRFMEFTAQRTESKQIPSQLLCGGPNKVLGECKKVTELELKQRQRLSGLLMYMGNFCSETTV